MMNTFRIKWILKSTTLITGVIFLNMSFFLAEVSALKLDKDKKMVENIAKLIAGAATEEEKDACGGAQEDLKTDKEIDLLIVLPSFDGAFVALQESLLYLHDFGDKPIAGNSKTVYCPPEA